MKKKTLLIPCAGRSSRYPGTRPKWMLTTPEGQLMIERAAQSLSEGSVERVVIGTLTEFEELYGVRDIIRRTCLRDAEIVLLDQLTSGPAETVRLMIEKAGVTGPICLKDSDSFFGLTELPEGSFVTVLDLRQNPQITSVGAKSFAVLNEQGLISDIVEKSVVSNFISVGLYGFSDASVFVDVYDNLKTRFSGGEFFISHVISAALNGGELFHPVMAQGFQDVGTLNDWRDYCSDFSTLVLDLDGVVFVNHSKYFKPLWEEDDQPLQDNVNALLRLQAKGAQLMFMTARPEKYRAKTEASLRKLGLNIHALVMGCLHGRRYLVNDYAASNPYPSAVAVNLERNTGKLSQFVG
ncbi:MAG: hypothetical protein V4709_09135 [Pseudomonadota bacterium]